MSTRPLLQIAVIAAIFLRVLAVSPGNACFAAPPRPLDSAAGMITVSVYESKTPSLGHLARNPDFAEKFGEQLLRQFSVNDEVTYEAEILFDNSMKLWRLSINDTRDRKSL